MKKLLLKFLTFVIGLILFCHNVSAAIIQVSVSDDKTSGIVYALECINCVGISVSIVNMEKNEKVLECEEIEFDVTFVDFYNYSSKSITCVN